MQEHLYSHMETVYQREKFTKYDSHRYKIS